MAGYVGTSGGINFVPLRLTAEQVEQGQQRLYQRLYTPEAFGARLLGNLHRFHDVHYRPEPPRADNIVTFFRLAWHYLRQGRSAFKFFTKTLWKTLWHSPRSFSQMVIQLGMYDHFCKVHSHKLNWDPWTFKDEQQPAQTQPVLPQPIQEPQREVLRKAV